MRKKKNEKRGKKKEKRKKEKGKRKKKKGKGNQWYAQVHRIFFWKHVMLESRDNTNLIT